MKKSLVLLAIILVACNQPVGDSAQELNQKAAIAYQNQDYAAWLGHLEKLHALAPNSPFTTYNLACAYALNNRPAAALAALENSIAMGLGAGADRDPDFSSIKDSPEFQRLLEKAAALNQPVNNSTEAFIINEPDLIPEGIAYNPLDGSFFVGSLYKSKLIRIDRDGRVSDFTGERQDGLRPVTGLKVDSLRGELLVCSQVSTPNQRLHDPAEMGWSGIFRYELNSGRLLKKYTLFEAGYPHLFNDLVILKNGDIYITDSSGGNIYRIRRETDTLELFLHSGNFTYPNGIALRPDETGFYLAGALTGVVLVDIESAKFKPLKQPAGCTTVGIDGLYFFDNSLVAVQNGLGRISRFYLNSAGDTILRSELIEFANPVFNIPTTGAIAGNTFYYLANSQLRAFAADGSILPPEQLAAVVILKTELK